MRHYLSDCQCTVDTNLKIIKVFFRIIENITHFICEDFHPKCLPWRMMVKVPIPKWWTHWKMMHLSHPKKKNGRKKEQYSLDMSLRRRLFTIRFYPMQVCMVIFKDYFFHPHKMYSLYNMHFILGDVDIESTKWFADIKANLGRAIALRELRPGVVTWVSRLNKYIRMYGLKFPKHDHIALIKLLMSFVTAEGNH